MTDEDDLVIPIGPKRLRVPAAVIDGLPLANNFTFGGSLNRGVVVFFLTDEPTAEEIGSAGVERVAKHGVRMTTETFLKFADWVQHNANRLREQGE